jgi:hypothetical protein
MKGIIAGGVVSFLALLVVLAWLLGSRAKARLIAKYPPPGQMVDVGGYRLHIHCQGEGRPGTPALSSTFRVICHIPRFDNLRRSYYTRSRCLFA